MAYSETEPTGGGSESTLVDEAAFASLVMARWHHSREMYRGFLTQLPTWYNTYRGYYRSPVQSFRNNVHLPILFSTVQNDVARKVQMTFSQWPIVQMMGYGPEDAAVARKNEVLISAQMKDSQSFKKAVDFYVSADLYGTAVLQYGWKRDQRKEKFRAPVQATPVPQPNGVVGERFVTRFDGPDWMVRDLLDCAPATNSKWLEEMDYFITRQFLDLDHVEDLAAQGFYKKSALDKLRRTGGPSNAVVDEYKERRGQQRTQMEGDSGLLRDKYAKPVEIHEYWGIVPKDMAPDGIVHRVISVANGTVVLRNEPNPFYLNEKPFLMYSPMPDPHFPFGPGRIEVGAKMQWSANRLASQKLDVMDLIVDPVLLYDKNRFRALQELQVRAGKPIGVDGDPNEALKPLTFDIRGVQLAYTEIDQMWTWIEQGLGIQRDTIAGGPNARRQTRAEFVGRQESGLTRLGLEGRLAEEAWVEPLANVYRGLNKQFLPMPKELKILGMGATVNPVTGLPMAPEQPVVLTLDDINADYDVRAVGSSQMINRQMQQQNGVLLLQAISANPVAAQMVNWVAYFRNLFMLFDYKNVDELLNTNPALQAAAANANQEGQQNGTAAAGAQKPSDFSPEFLQSLQFGSRVGQPLLSGAGGLS